MNRRLSLLVALMLVATVVTATLANAGPSAEPNGLTASVAQPAVLAAVGDPAATVTVKETSTSTAFSFAAATFDVSTSIPVTDGSAGGGATVGKANLKPLVLTKTFDASTIAMQNLLVRGKHIFRVTLKVSGGGYTLGDALVTDIRSTGAGGDQLPADRVTIHYGKIRISHPDASMCWSEISNTAVCP